MSSEHIIKLFFNNSDPDAPSDYNPEKHGEDFGEAESTSSEEEDDDDW